MINYLTMNSVHQNIMIDKLDAHPPDPVLSPRALYREKHHSHSHLSRFPIISAHSSHHQHLPILNAGTPKNGRGAFMATPTVMNTPVPEEINSGRGPKVYGKNLPDVFNPNTPGIKRIKKVLNGHKERSQGERSLENKPIERPLSVMQNSRNTSGAFVSPVRLIQLKNKEVKDHRKTPVDSGNMSTLESITCRNHHPANSDTLHRLKSYHYVNAKSISPRHHFIQNFFSPNLGTPGEIHTPTHLHNQSLTTSKKERKGSDDFNKQIKKLIVFKKATSRSPEPSPQIVLSHRQIDATPTAVKIVQKEQLPAQILQLNELITLRKIKTTNNRGILKRMVHAPTFRIYDIQEEPISELRSKETASLKDWLSLWKKNFVKSRYLMRVYSCFWNSPEGCVSVLTEPAKCGFLQDYINQNGSLPESCIQTIAKDILQGIIEIQEKTNREHGLLTPAEIMITETGNAKICPGISQHSNRSAPRVGLVTHEDQIIHRHHKPGSDLTNRSPSPGPGQSVFNEMPNDIFDFGLILLQCALGDLTFYDSLAQLTSENIKAALESLIVKKSYRYSCCILHSEDVVKKGLGLASGNSSLIKRKILTNNFSIKSPRVQSAKPTARDSKETTQTSANSLMGMLMLGDRFTESFIDLLCCCLKLDPSLRMEPKDLLQHEFFNENRRFIGPMISMKDMVNLDYRELKGGRRVIESVSTKHLDKFMEALRVVFLNKEVKIKFQLIMGKQTKREIEERKVRELARELDVDEKELAKALKDCLKNEDFD